MSTSVLSCVSLFMSRPVDSQVSPCLTEYHFLQVEEAPGAGFPVEGALVVGAAGFCASSLALSSLAEAVLALAGLVAGLVAGAGAGLVAGAGGGAAAGDPCACAVAPRPRRR